MRTPKLRPLVGLAGLATGLLLLGALPACSKMKAALDHGEGGAAADNASPLAFLSGFEGEIDLSAHGKASPGEAPVTLALFVKSDKLRMDFPEKMKGAEMLGGKGYGIWDTAAKTISIVSDPQKQVIVIDLNKSGEQLKGFSPPTSHGHAPGAPSGPPPKVTKTGKFDTVAGYKCENWDIASDHKEGTMCIADQGTSWLSLPITGIPTEHAWMAEVMDGKHFPLRFIGYEKDGATESARIEVTKIDKKTLPPTEFQVPPTYKVIDMAQMFQGLGNLPGGPGGPGFPHGGFPHGPPGAFPHGPPGKPTH